MPAPTDPSPGHLVFSHAVEAFFLRAMVGKLEPKLIDALKEVGVDLNRPLLPAYPFGVWVRALELTADLAFAELPREQAFFVMGQLLVTSYQETVIGRALFTALRLFPARKVIDRMARNFRTSNNFTEVDVVEIAPQTVDLVFNRVESEPAFTQGILATGLPAAGVNVIDVKRAAFDGVSATYRVSWK